MLSDYQKKKLFELIKKGKFNSKNCFEWDGPFDQDGYGITTVSLEKQRKTWKVHRLIYFLLLGEMPDGFYICHACDNPKCFNLCHLFLGTAKDNALDREKKGRSRVQAGEKNSMSKLNECTVLQIRKKYSEGSKVGELAIEFNIKQPTITKIVHRKRWIHI